MKKENDELFNLFTSRLENAEMPVRDGFWEKLENEIPVVLQSRRKIMMRRFSAAASVLLILGGASAAFWYISPKDEIADAFKEIAVSTGTKGTIEKDGVITELPPLPIASSINNPVKRIVSFQSMDEVDFEESFSISLSMSFSVTGDRVNSQPGQNQYAGGTGKPVASQQETQESVASASTPEKKQKDRKWSAGVFVSASPGGEYTQKADALPEGEEYTRMKHKASLSAGMTVKRELSKRFSLETGLVYTQLNSELSGEAAGIYPQEQKNHYLGIPLKGSYTVFENNHLDLYTTAGAMLEKCIAGKAKPDPLQLSLVAALGVQYKFNDRISVYAEPGLSYHFDDGSSVNTIRKERPLNFNLLCGVRMTY